MENDHIKHILEQLESGQLTASDAYDQLKLAPFEETESGITAFDSYVPLGMQLIREGLLEPLAWVEKVTLAPARVAQIQQRWEDELGWVLIDPELTWSLDKNTILSHGKNTPLINQQMQGKVLRTFIG